MNSRYTQIIAKIFETKFREGEKVIRFERAEIVTTARDLGIELPKNLGDVVTHSDFATNSPTQLKKQPLSTKNG